MSSFYQKTTLQPGGPRIALWHSSFQSSCFAIKHFLNYTVNPYLIHERTAILMRRASLPTGPARVRRAFSQPS